MTKNRKTFFKQCSFFSETKHGRKEHVAWIPEKFAQVGRVIYFGNKTETPETLWTVETVGDFKKDGDYLMKHERDYKIQRKASDI